MNIPQQKAERHMQALEEMRTIILDHLEEEHMMVLPTKSRKYIRIHVDHMERVFNDLREDYFAAIEATDDDRNDLFHA